MLAVRDVSNITGSFAGAVDGSFSGAGITLPRSQRSFRLGRGIGLRRHGARNLELNRRKTLGRVKGDTEPTLLERFALIRKEKYEQCSRRCAIRGRCSEPRGRGSPSSTVNLAAPREAGQGVRRRAGMTHHDLARRVDVLGEQDARRVADRGS
jgi:hypothetical protein